MPKTAKTLQAQQVAHLPAPPHAAGTKRSPVMVRYPVGGVRGLLLAVTETGTRSWILRARVSGKRKDIGLGAYPEVSLADARQRAKELREQIWRGIDPVCARVARKAAAALAAQHTTPTFAWCAEQAMKKKRAELRNPKSAAQWGSTLTMYAFPVMGRLPVDAVTLQHVLSVLTPIWATKTETAKRLRGRVEFVLAWATVSGYRSGDNPARLRGNLDAVLPKAGKLHKVRHHPALPVAAMHGFMVALRKRDGMAARALEFAILTAARSGEVRGMTWAELDLPAAAWVVPATRMKAGRTHRVPLCARAVALLRALPVMAGSDYVFWAARGGALSDMSISAVCRRMGVAAVPHGFRSTFRDWTAEHTNTPREVAEMALAHAVGNKVEAAYRRGDLYAKRAKLMADWGKFIDTAPTTGNVVALRKGKQA